MEAATNTSITTWVLHVITALLGGGIAGIGTYLKMRADSRKVNAETGTEIIQQAQTVVEMWQQWGAQQQLEITDLKNRVATLETDGSAKAARIRELEELNKTKDRRIRELEREVSELQGKVKRLEGAS